MIQEAKDLSAKVVTKLMLKPRLKVRYPRVEGLPNSSAQHKINNRIMEQVYQLIRDQGYVEEPAKEMTGEFKVELNERGIISFLFDIRGFTQGDAHGITLQKSVTMDLSEGREYKLQDLFLPGTDYQKSLDAVITDQIRVQDLTMFDLTGYPGIKPDQTYYLLPENLVIYFTLYEFTPYPNGLPAFFVPYSKLSDTLNPAGPISWLT